MTIKQNNTGYQLALAIDAVKSRIEDYANGMRWVTQSIEDHDLSCFDKSKSQHEQWNAEDAAKLLERAIELIEPSFND